MKESGKLPVNGGSGMNLSGDNIAIVQSINTMMLPCGAVSEQTLVVCHVTRNVTTIN